MTEITRKIIYDSKKKYSLYDLNNIYNDSPSSIINQTIKLYGIVRRIRSGIHGGMIFIDVYDGTIIGDIKTLASCDTYLGEKYSDSDQNDASNDKVATEFTTLTFEQLNDISMISPGCSVMINGKLVNSPDFVKQKYELQIYCLRVIGNVENPVLYPIQKSVEKHLIGLRQLPFERPQAQAIQALFRIRSKLLFTIHEFFNDNNIFCIDPNIITSSDCEGAGEMFKVLGSESHMFSTDANGLEIPVGLTVSSQLPLEALIKGFRHVYTCQKSFRAEKSDTSKHLSEFLHVEYEGEFITFDELLDFTESFVKHIIVKILERCKDEYDYFETNLAPDELRNSRKTLLEILKKPFIRIKHRDAILAMQQDIHDKVQIVDDDGKSKRLKMKVYPKIGCDLDSEHEKYLVKKYGGFVFVTHWPLKIKSFYMKQCDNDDVCESFDLLAPHVGEMFGGSMREWRYQKLLTEMQKRNMDMKPLQWYVDLRKSGSAPHGGWGMGFDRMLMFLTSVPSVRDIVPFPVYYKHCPY